MSHKKKGGARLLKEQKAAHKEKEIRAQETEPLKPEKNGKEAAVRADAAKKGDRAKEGPSQAVKGPERKKEDTKGPEKATSPAAEKPRRTPLQQALRIGYIVLTVIAGIIVAVGIFLMNFVQKPVQVEQPDRPPVLPNTSASPDPTGTPTQNPGQQSAPSGVSSDRKEDFYTFLVVGRDTYGGGNTDTILLASYDVPNQVLSVMSIPRDTLVNVSWDIKKINSVYNVYGGGEKGMDALKEEVSQLVGFRPDYTVVVEWEAIGELVDAIGGVYFTVPRRMYYNDLSQNFKIDLQKGYQKLNGKQAMQLLRYRHDSDDNGNILNSGYADGDLGRIKVQQDFLKATIEQCLANIGDLNTIKGLAQVFFENVTTPLSVGNLAWFAQQAILGNSGGEYLTMDRVGFFTMPWVSADGVWSRTYKNHPSYVAPNVDELVELVNQRFNPYRDDLRESELDIMYVNRDGTLGCTGGKLEDTRYNTWILDGGGYAASTPEPSDEPDEPSPEPSDEPTDEPTEEPTGEPGSSDAPTGEPTQPPDPSESNEPTSSPGLPGDVPTVSPEPSGSPSAGPIPSPSPAPSPEPAPSPSEELPTPTPAQEPSPTNGPPEGLPIIPQG